MKRLALALSLCLLLAACGGGTSSDISGSSSVANQSQSASQSQNTSTVQEVVAPDLTGTWMQDEHDKTTYFHATIQDDTIELRLHMEDGTDALCWAGTYIAPETDAEPYVWTSENDMSHPDRGLLASTSETKDFTYENGQLSCTVTVMGQEGTLIMDKTGDADQIPDDAEGSSSANTNVGFSDNVLVTDDYTIKITDYRVIQPGEEGNEYSDVPVIAFWYDTTVTTENPNVEINPSFAWITAMTAIQDNDPNMVNELSLGMLPDDSCRETQMATIKPGGTVSCAVAYELDDTTTPVMLVAEDILGDEYGSQEFSIA